MRWLAILSALVPGVALSAAPSPSSVTAEVFNPPAGPLILTRTLHRGLPDGKEIVAIRRYAVRIVREGDGFRVDGRLLTATVDSPPALAALAEIERRRSDTGLFPLRLDARGLIASIAFPVDRAASDEARAVAQRSIAGSALSESQRRQAETFVGQVVARGAASSGAKWPADLFNPAPGKQETTDRVALPSGGAGSVTITIRAHRSAEGSAIERTVVTATGADRRTTREIYTLAPQAD
jgi:hypothetical protein